MTQARSSRLVAGVFIAGAIGAGLFAATPLPSTAPPLTPGAANKVTSFADDHPEFAPLREGRTDATRIKFPHKLHLEKTWGDDAPEGKKGRPLACADCHAPDSDFRFMKPITFEANCRTCHTGQLGSIDAAPGVVPSQPTPHGQPEEIGELVEIAVRRWAMLNGPTPKPSAAPSDAATPAGESKPAESSGGARGNRRGGGSAEAPKKPATLSYSTSDELDAIVAKARADTYKAQAKGTKCGYCHTIEAAPDTDKGGVFTVLRPNIPSRWLTKAVFNHDTHRIMDCKECHASAVSSESAADINLPGIKTCRECHSPRGGATDSCVLCHVYHARSERTTPGHMTIPNILDNKHAPQPQALPTSGQPVGTEKSGEGPRAPAQ